VGKIKFTYYYNKIIINERVISMRSSTIQNALLNNECRYQYKVPPNGQGFVVVVRNK